MTFSSPEPVVVLRDLFLPHAPPVHARMTEPTYNAKYLRVQSPITDEDLAAHLAGDLTLACVLQRDDLAQVAACDIDMGGEAMVRRVMRAAETRACHVYGFVLDSDQHSGGHVWIFFERPHPARDLQVLMRDIVTEAQCRTGEVYPSQADLRLPFGLHRRCNRRGTLLLNSAAIPLDLDADLPGALARFLEEVRHTSDLPVRVAREAQEAHRREVMTSIAAARPRRVDPDAHWREVIAQFNASTNLVSLLEGYGARPAYHYGGGKVLMHCAASQDHAHGDKHASLVVEMGRGHQAGRMICGCYCPVCRLHNSPGQVMDAFEVYCRLEGISKREAVSRLQQGKSVPQAPQPVSKPQATLAASADADTATQTSTPTHAITAPASAPISPTERAVQQRLVAVNVDTRVQPLDRRLLAYLISHEEAGQGIANAALAAALGAQPDSIKRAKRRLRTLGYIEVAVSRDGVHPSVIRVVDLPESAPPEDLHAVVERESTKAPPFHVESGFTCDGGTRLVESSNSLEQGEHSGMPAEKGRRCSLDEQSVCYLRRRQGVLRGLLRYRGTARQHLAWHAEIGDIQAALDRKGLLEVPDAQQPQLPGLGASSTIPQVGVPSHRLRLANPDDEHPKLTDQQLTALLRDAFEAQGDTVLRVLLERVSWRLEGETVVVICMPRDLAAVTERLRVASWLALMDMLPERGLSVTVRVGQPECGEVRPAWVPGSLWVRVPLWLRPLLVGSRVVEGRLYGVMRERTEDLAMHSEVMIWLLDQVAMYTNDMSLVSNDTGVGAREGDCCNSYGVR